MVTICEQCGDRGFPEALIYCEQCQIATRHQYCLDVLPQNFEDDVIWYCDNCESNVAEPTGVVNLNSHLAITCGSEKLEVIQPIKSAIIFKEKNDVDQVKNEQNRSNLRGSLAISEVCQSENSTCHHLDVHCSENHQRDQKFRRWREPDGNKADEGARSVKTKTSLIALGDCKSKPEYTCELHCSDGHKKNAKDGRETALDGSSSVEATESFKTKTFLVVTNDPANGNKPDEGAQSVKTQTSLKALGDCKSKPEYSCELHCSDGDKKKEKDGRETALDGSSSVEATESFKTKAFLVVTNDPANGNKPDEGAQSVKTKTSLIALGDCRSKPEYSCELRCSDGDKKNEKDGRETALDGSSSVEATESFRTKAFLVVTNDPANASQNNRYDYKQPITELCGSEDDKGNNKSKRQKVPVTNSSDQGIFTRNVIQNFVRLRQGYNEPVREYMMKAMAYLNQAELLGAVIDEETKMNMVLSSLSDTFKQFKLDYELHHKNYSLVSLMHDLQKAEAVFKAKQGDTNVAKGSTSVSVKAFCEEKKKVKRKKKKELKPKGKCFHCGVDGHWKRNCLIYLTEKKCF